MGVLRGQHLSPATEIKKGEHRSPATEFKKGFVPQNKGKKWDEWMSVEGQASVRKHLFKKGGVPPTANPEGTVKYAARKRKNGIIEHIWTINIDWHGNRKSHNNYRKYLWEVAHQQDAPKGAIFTPINGDYSEKPTIENIEIIDRKTLLSRNRGW